MLEKIVMSGGGCYFAIVSDAVLPSVQGIRPLQCWGAVGRAILAYAVDSPFIFPSFVGIVGSS